MSARLKDLEQRCNREIASLLTLGITANEPMYRSRLKEAFDAVSFRIGRACQDVADAILREISTAGAVLDSRTAAGGFEELAAVYELRGRMEREARTKFELASDQVFGRWTGAANGVRALAAQLEAGQSPRDAVAALFGLASNYAGVRM